MKTLLTIILLLIAVPVLAQAPVAQATLSPEVQSLVNQIHAAGCQAEETVAAQTIDQLRKENAGLRAQIQKLDPPKSGATKH